jgi:hypothetical protein
MRRGILGPMPVPDPISHELDGFNAKLARATRHFDAVERALKKVTNSDPDLIPGEFDGQAHLYVFRAQRDSLSSTAVSPIVGDCVHNLRAALDYLVWELTPEAVRRSKDAARIEFPIFTKPLDYKAGAMKKIGSIDPAAQAVIMQLQPFAGPNSEPWNPNWRDPETEPLALLYQLDKWDKHRSLNLTEDNIAATLVGFDQLGIMVPPTPAKLPGRYKRGAILAAAEAPLGRPEVAVYVRAAYDISFERGGPAGGEPVIQTLNHIRQEVRNRVFPALYQFFPSPI